MAAGEGYTDVVQVLLKAGQDRIGDIKVRVTSLCEFLAAVFLYNARS